MVTSRARSIGLLASFAAALMLAVTLIWAAGAQSRPVPSDRIANVQTLGGDLDALEAHVSSLPQPFEAPDPSTDPRITRQG